MKQAVLEFFRKLTEAQEKTLAVLQKKQKALVKPDNEALKAMSGEEGEALTLLKSVVERRILILEEARKRDMKVNSIQDICKEIFPHQSEWRAFMETSQAKSQQIRFAALTNWTVSQKSMVHLTQILEFIETRGEGKTTYSGKPPNGGAVIDRAA